MAEKDSFHKPKDLIEPVPEEGAKLEKEIEKTAEKDSPFRGRRRDSRERDPEAERQRMLDAWIPKTALGRAVKAGTMKDFEGILASGRKILEPEIVVMLLHVES